MRYRYLIFHKPYNVLSQFTPSTAHRTLADFISIPTIYPAGRLDADSEGLLVLTDDGPLQHQLTDPKFAHPRTYWAQVEGEIHAQALSELASGVTIQGYRTKPAKARRIAEPPLAPRDPPIRIRKSIPTSWIELMLTEGRNRQVRRMTAKTGFPTLRLIRCAVGDLTLEGLNPGEWREITRRDLTHQ